MNGDEQRRQKELRELAAQRRRAAESARLAERGYEEYDRGYEEYDRGYEEYDRGYEEYDRGYEEYDRGYEEYDRGRAAGGADPRRVAADAFRQASALGGHFIVAFVTPIGRGPGSPPRPGGGLRDALSFVRKRRAQNGGAGKPSGKKIL
jgi:hypothetical protein